MVEQGRCVEEGLRQLSCHPSQACLGAAGVSLLLRGLGLLLCSGSYNDQDILTRFAKTLAQAESP